MHDDLELSVIERHHDADPQFRKAVRTRLVAILDGSDAIEVPDHLSVQSTEEQATMIDLETPSETEEHRKGPKRVLLAGLLVAAAVAAIALVAIRNDDPVSPANQPSTTVTVPPTTPPRALPDSIPLGERLVPGTYFVDDVEGTPTPRILFTIGAGWTDMLSDQATDGYGGPAFSHPGAVFKDACHWEDGYHPGPLTTLDGLVAALAEQGGWAEVTAPSNISVDGYAGKAFQRTVPADISDCDTMRYGPRNLPQEDRGKMLPAFRSWQTEEGELTPDTGGNLAGFGYEAGMVETLWVLDIQGTVVVINSRPVPEASAADRDVFAAVLDSIRIERA